MDSSNEPSPSTIISSFVGNTLPPAHPTYGFPARPLLPIERYGYYAALPETTSCRKVVHPKWLLVMASNIHALARINRWNLISLPPPACLITCKWVYKVKTDDTLELYKARLMVRTRSWLRRNIYSYIYGPRDPSSHTSSMWLLFAASLSLSLMSRMPKSSHHLNSLPNGMVCHLRRCLYGPKQTPRAWFNRFILVVIAAGFWRVLMILHFQSTIQLMVKHFFYMPIITGDDS